MLPIELPTLLKAKNQEREGITEFGISSPKNSFYLLCSLLHLSSSNSFLSSSLQLWSIDEVTIELVSISVNSISIL